MTSIPFRIYTSKSSSFSHLKQVRQLEPNVTLCARDGAMMLNRRQLDVMKLIEQLFIFLSCCKLVGCCILIQCFLLKNGEFADLFHSILCVLRMRVDKGQMERSSNWLKRDDGLKTTWCCKPRIGAIREQLKQIPEDASHVVISVGGNNATGASSTVLGEPVTDCEEATCSWEPYPDLSCSKSSEKNTICIYLYDFYSWIFILYAIQQALARLHDFAVTFEADFAAEMMLGVFKE